MRPDLPWNVAGIPPEAREAARAAARREGLSVGEWLTRRILRSFADAGDEEELTRDSYATSRTYRPEEPLAPPPRSRETDEMLEHVSRNAAETNDVYRRIEEQLKGVARRMESQERTQTENNRVMSKAATEMHIAAREQAQAFDQMGSHVVNLADRLERVERANSSSGLKDAVKGLHTGLSRLADQITANATQSANQIGSLATNLEAVANRLGEAREETQGLEQRLAALDDRIYVVEKAAQNTASALERALEALNARTRDDREAEHREAGTAQAIARLEENVTRLEARGPDPEIERRLSGIEQNLGSIAEKLEAGDSTATAKAIEDSLRKLVSRVEATENRQRDTVSEFRNVLSETTSRLAAVEAKAAAVAAAPPPPAPSYAPPPTHAFDAPPFPDVPTPGAPPPFQASHDPFATEPPLAFDDAPPPYAEDPFGPAPGSFEASPPPAGDTFLSAARRSARAAATAAEAEQTSRGFAWGAGKNDSGEQQPGRTRYVLIALVVLIAVALIGGLVLSQGLGGSGHKTSGLGALFSARQATPAPQAGTPLHAAPGDDTVNAAPQQQAADLPPLQRQAVNAAPIRTVPAAAQPAQTPTQTASLDRLTALANGGNPKAETIVGLKYLNGEGVAVNEAQAFKWLERAAASGEPMAEYRLGKLYEDGKGTPVSSAKATHWYQAAAMQGNRKAMHNVAVAYAEGTGIKKDMTEAARWFSKAAALGFADSQFNLAVLYERGLGVPQSLLDAYKWYAIAAANGDAESKSRIDALSTQLSADDLAAARNAAATFRPAPLDARANAIPAQTDLPQG